MASGRPRQDSNLGHPVWETRLHRPRTPRFLNGITYGQEAVLRLGIRLKDQMSKQIAWKALALVAAGAAAWAGRKATTLVWTRISDSDEPSNPARRDTSWGEAIGWAVLAGAIAATARVLAQRGAAQAWEATMGESPPAV